MKTNFEDSLLIDNEFDSFELDSSINNDINMEYIDTYDIDSTWSDSINF
jgi:hypothetical protein